MVKITVVRHGETEWNKLMQLQGHTDSPLTKRGLAQAELLSEYIRYRSFDVLISSDLYRAAHTAKLINKHLGLPIIKNKDIRERSFGILEGHTLLEIQEKYNTAFKAYTSRKSTFELPDGESLVQFNERVIGAIHEIANQYKGKSILLVAHGGVLDCIIRHIFNIDLDTDRNFSVLNTSVNTITISDGKWKLEEWGNTEHLKQTEALDEFN